MPDEPTLTILHTNDLHNHLKPEQADRLQALRRDLAGGCLLLDAGDAVASGNITYRPGGEAILERMAAAGYDAMTVGNREFHFTQTGFRCKIARASFPVLCANVGPSRQKPADGPEGEADNPPALPVRPYVVLQPAPQWRVLILGLTVPMITERMLARKVSPYVFSNPIATAARLVPALREKYRPDLFIALTHVGLRGDRELAATVPGIDLILGGHSHDTLPDGERVGNTLIAQTGFFGHNYGRIAIERGAGEDQSLSLAASVATL